MIEEIERVGLNLKFDEFGKAEATPQREIELVKRKSALSITGESIRTEMRYAERSREPCRRR